MSYCIETLADVPGAVELFRMGYERANVAAGDGSARRTPA